MTEQEAVAQILCEVKRAREKFRWWPDDYITAAAIVGEESGELLKAALQERFEAQPRSAIHKEAVQTAAMCIRLLCRA